MDDRALIAAVGAIVSVPREAPADSFVLHAPLELLARAGLLLRVDPPARDDARDQIRALGEKYEAAGPPVEPPAPVEVQSVADGIERLLAAVAAGELDDVDRYAQWVGARVTALELQAALAQPIAASLAAAAHGSILLDLLPRIALAAGVDATIVRGPARELARHPDWQLRWFEDPVDDIVAATDLGQALLAVPMLGLPGSDFIFPIMNQAEESGLATKLLASVASSAADAPGAGRELARVAAWSMLQEPPDYAPYGWSHCLTMPQSVIALAGHGSDPRTAVAVAATHVVGFRAALGQRVLEPDAEPASPRVNAVWHAPADEITRIETDLATGAATHEDAHLVKYTLACFDAATNDPDHRRLYLAAATALHEWWSVPSRLSN